MPAEAVYHMAASDQSLTTKRRTVNSASHHGFVVLSCLILSANSVIAGEFEGGGGSIYIGTGTPNSIDAATRLATDLNVNDETGNYAVGLLGFYQADRFRVGGAIQAHAWGGVNPGSHGADDGTAGVAAVIGAAYGTYTFHHDRLLLNVGGLVGAGRCFLGFSLDNGTSEQDESVSTFYLEPHISFGVATCPYFGVEFQFSAPIFILTEDLTLNHADRMYTVTSSDMAGVHFSIKLTFGRFANP
jgi:hypothetical protein